jgi:hypothetical protein
MAIASSSDLQSSRNVSLDSRKASALLREVLVRDDGPSLLRASVSNSSLLGVATLNANAD